MATEPRQLRNISRWRFLGTFGALFGLYWLVNGLVIPGIFVSVGGLMLLPVVNRYVVHVPVPVGGALIAIGILISGQ